MIAKKTKGEKEESGESQNPGGSQKLEEFGGRGLGKSVPEGSGI